MGFSQPKVQLRLCEQLRIHAPQIFGQGNSQNSDSQSKYSNTYSSSTHPPYQAGPPYHNPSRSMPPQHEPMYSGHKQHSHDTPTDHSIQSRTNLVWQGNLARNGKKLTESLAIRISGQCSTYLSSGLETINITHRLKCEEASKNVPLAVFSIHSANNLKLDPFVEYIEYFKNKNRIGVAPIGNDINIYICAPGNPLYDKHMPDGLKTPTLIGLVVSVEPVTSNQSARLQQSNGDWLNQLSTITAMLGTKK